MSKENLSSDNLLNHATARLRTFKGTKAGFDANIAVWQKLLTKQNQNTDAFKVCPACEKNFSPDDIPYFGIFLISGKRTNRIICKQCAYRLSRNVIEADGTMHNGECSYKKGRR